MSEPEIIINGVRLTEGQAMTVRVAVTEFWTDPDCGDDDDGRRITEAYKERAAEVLKIMIPQREVRE